MNNQARQILQECIRDYGRMVGHEPQRLEALLKDYAKGHFKREIFVIIQAAKENVVDQLLDNTAPLELISVTLSHQLTENYGIDRQLADWAIESWLFALNLSRSTNKVEPAKQKTPTNGEKPQPDIKSIALIDGRYLDNGDGTVTDQTTGLQWMRCSIGQSWDGTTCQGDAESYDWEQANQVAEDFNFAGFDDWRLPTIDELKSILEKDKKPSFLSPWINENAFPKTGISHYWSSSDADLSDYARVVWFFRGRADTWEKHLDDCSVRLVRGGQKTPTIGEKPQPDINSIALIDGRYLDNGDGTVTDQTTGLQWMRCSIGQSWDGKTCQGDAETYNWYQANQVAEDFNFAGYNDWRLPTIDELKSIIEKNKNPSINDKAFPRSPASYVWSSSPNAGYSSYAWGVSFNHGHVINHNKTHLFHVRLVRGG